ncbi:helix-turn-helix transcriptional regulator [Streptomyces sp. NPDC006733]|uniref:helix-turn-helix domain-containing protein n=1 Tax=Streptomyces sp. NPDC006733 TaxID=3155460 RepID=UPI0033F4A547
MALRTTITERQRRLGVELRKLREQAELTLNEAGAFIDMGRVHLTHVEGGRTAIAPDRIRSLCRGYGCTSSTLVAALVGMAENTGKGWWSAYKGKLPLPSLDLAELESQALGLHSYESLFIPGMFQLPDYTRAVFEASDAVTTPAGVETAVSFRMERQAILTGDAAPEVHAVIHEAALHMRFGGSEVMRRQLLQLVELAKLPNVTIQVVPFTATGVSGLNTPFCSLTSHGGALETVLLDHPAESLFVHAPESVAKYRRLFDRLCNEALAPIDADVAPASHDTRDSLGLIQYVLYTL